MPTGIAIAALTELAAAQDAEAARRALSRARFSLGDEAAALEGLMQQLCERAEELSTMRRLAGSDVLTGAANRRTFSRALARELARLERGGRGPGVLLFDLDGLKQINDQLGHAAGDEAIVRAVAALEYAVRGTDIVARFGGDELAVLLPEASEDGVRQAAERMRDQIEMQDVQGRPLRISVGWAFAGRRGMDADTLMAFADSRLYADKRGRRGERMLGVA